MVRKTIHRLYFKILKFVRGEDAMSEFGPSKITGYLYVGKQPKSPGDYGILEDLNIGLIINASAHCVPEPDSQPIRTIWIKAYDDPFMPPISFMDVKYAVEEALKIERSGRRIYAHCRAGRHRSVAVAACMLVVSSNLSAEGAMALIKFMRPLADPYHPPIEKVIREFAKYWVGNKDKEEDRNE